MKPIILVIMSGAMLMLANHRNTINESKKLSHQAVERTPHLMMQERKHDTELLMHSAGFWFDHFQ